MATNYDATVNAFYLAYYGRPADPAGLAFWSQALSANNGDFNDIITAFSTSPEATSHFTSESAADHVTAIYQQLFGRAPDAAGLAYWSAAIANGAMTLASAALEIMNGAQSTDATTSTLRQQAAADFTAKVEASGVAYSGDAAIEAARVVIAAVTSSSSASDIQSLVNAGASLAQTAHDNPTIIAALANGGDLSTLLSSASGQSDPVGLVQALATLGKAALSDPFGLTTLLHGGGVAGLLASLPSGTSLTDVATAVSTGGLSAGAGVANGAGSTDTTPPVQVDGPTIAFLGIDGKDLPAGTTLAANSIWYFIDVHGAAKDTIPTFQVSANGTTGWTTMSEDDPLSSGTHYVRYLVTGTDGVNRPSNTLKLVMDSDVTSPTLQLAHDTGISSTDGISSDGTITVSGLHANEAWTYSFDGGKTWTVGAAADSHGVATIPDSGLTGSSVQVLVRTLETVNGNSGFTSTSYTVAIDKTAPAPVVALTHDVGTGGAHATLDGSVSISGLDAHSTWEYSFDSGNTWNPGTALVNGVATINSPAAGGVESLEVRASDNAGNASDIVTFNYTYNKLSIPVAATLSLEGDATQASSGSANSAHLAFNLDLHGPTDATATYQISTTGAADSFQTWDPQQTLNDGSTYYFRATGTDTAGDNFATNVLTVHVDNTAPPAPTVQLHADTGASSTDGVTSDGQYTISGLEQGATWEYSIDNGLTWSAPQDNVQSDGTTTGFLPADGAQTLVVRALDAAGNISANSNALAVTYDSHVPLGGLHFDHIVGEDAGAYTTSNTSADVVFSYTDAAQNGDTLQYSFDDGTTWTPIDSAMIDTANKTVTFSNVDLSQKDAFIEIETSDVAGNTTYASVGIDGPVTSYGFAQTTSSGIKMFTQSNAQFYLTDGSDPSVQLETSAPDQHGQVTVGAQTTAVQGVLGSGPDAASQTHNDTYVYAFGTTGGDTLAGSNVWGFDGDDTITAVTSSQPYNSVIYGGLGSDSIHVESTGSKLMYDSAAESSIVSDASAAHGFDTVYVTTGTTSLSETFQLGGVTLSNVFQVSTSQGAYTGMESGADLLALLTSAVGGHFDSSTDSQGALVDVGNVNGQDVHFLVVDVNKDHTVDANDYVVEIVGAIQTSDTTFSTNGLITLKTGIVAS